MKKINYYLFYLVLFLIFLFKTTAAYALELETFGGWEGDTRNQGFGFVTLGTVYPLNSKTALVGRVTGSFLYYHFDSSNSTTDVTSPGVTLLGGTRLSIKRATFLLLGGAEQRWNRTAEKMSTGGTLITKETERGFVAQGMIDTPISRITGLNLLINYSGANQYTFGRLGVKRQISNQNRSSPYTFSIGIEGIGQGNDDITSAQGGGFVEIFHGPTKVSLMLKGGYKNSWFPDAPQKQGGYFGVNFYTSFK